MIPQALSDECATRMLFPKKVRFPSSDPKLQLSGILIEAPVSSSLIKFGRAPIILMAPGFGETIECGLLPFASRFNQQLGVHVLMFDNRSFGMSEGMPRNAPKQVVHTKTQLADWIYAIQFAKSLPNVDSDKIILWGASLAGGHVMELSSITPVYLAIAQVPLINGFETGMKGAHESKVLSHFKLGSSEESTYVAIKGVTDRMPVVYGEEPVFKGRLFKMTGIGTQRTFAAFNDIISRASFIIPSSYNPAKAIVKLASPLLFQFAQYDQFCPSERTKALIQKGNQQYITAIPYSGDHFLGYAWNDYGHFDVILGDQLKFIQSHLVESYGTSIAVTPADLNTSLTKSSKHTVDSAVSVSTPSETLSTTRKKQQEAYQVYISSATGRGTPKEEEPSVVIPRRTVSKEQQEVETPKRSTSLSSRSRSVGRNSGSGNAREGVSVSANGRELTK
ncbi:Alpha/Beta hydrolase protein [Chytriomyces sp. MP71]|nr:Alpha/Beta hydrolase protein [Chytriomyces sp. MP71]